MDERTSQLEGAQDAPLLLLHDGDVRRAVLDFEGQVFHYTLNKRGLRMLLVASGLALAGAVAIYVWMTFVSLLWFLASAALVVAAVVTLVTVWRWDTFSKTGFLALDDDYFYVGTSKRAWRISWELLDARALGFEEYSSERLSGLLKMQVAGQQIDLHLYHPLAYVDDLQGLMFALLSHMKGGPDQASLEEE